MNETQGLLYFGHSNWTICSLLSWFCSKTFPTFWALYWGLQFLNTLEGGRKEPAGAGNGEKWTLGHQFTAYITDFCRNFLPFLSFPSISLFFAVRRWTAPPESLTLKHKNRIIGHSFNPACGFSMMDQVTLCAVCLTENWLGSSLNQIQGRDNCPIILLSCFRARTSGRHGACSWSVGTKRQRELIRSFAASPQSS